MNIFVHSCCMFVLESQCLLNSVMCLAGLSHHLQHLLSLPWIAPLWFLLSTYSGTYVDIPWNKSAIFPAMLSTPSDHSQSSLAHLSYCSSISCSGDVPLFRSVDPIPPWPSIKAQPVDQCCAVGVQEPHPIHQKPWVSLAGGSHCICDKGGVWGGGSPDLGIVQEGIWGAAGSACNQGAKVRGRKIRWSTVYDISWGIRFCHRQGHPGRDVPLPGAELQPDVWNQVPCISPLCTVLARGEFAGVNADRRFLSELSVLAEPAVSWLGADTGSYALDEKLPQCWIEGLSMVAKFANRWSQRPGVIGWKENGQHIRFCDVSCK